eukprot:scaffold64733_cov62-Phaeocystis_antarctica.AAC.11
MVPSSEACCESSCRRSERDPRETSEKSVDVSNGSRVSAPSGATPSRRGCLKFPWLGRALAARKSMLRPRRPPPCRFDLYEGSMQDTASGSANAKSARRPMLFRVSRPKRATCHKGRS